MAKKRKAYGFARVMEAKPPYRGYGPGRDYLAEPNQFVHRATEWLFCAGRQQLQQLRQPLLGAGA